MNITCGMVEGMTHQEREIYFAHMEKRHREEREYMDARKQELIAYKKSLIEEVMAKHPENDREYLQKLTTHALEILTY